MGRKAGMRSGKLIGKAARLNGQYIHTTDTYTAADLQGDDFALSGVYNTIVSGVDVLGWSTTETAKARGTFVTPSGLPRNVKANINLYWTTSGVSTSDVVWDVDYRAVSVIASGAYAVSGVNYVTSGITSNATTTHSFVSGISGSGIGENGLTALQKTSVTIPATDIRADSLVLFGIYRDGDESADTLDGPVFLLAAEVEYVDE